jgi:hypothetical protein
MKKDSYGMTASIVPELREIYKAIHRQSFKRNSDPFFTLNIRKSHGKDSAFVTSGILRGMNGL